MARRRRSLLGKKGALGVPTPSSPSAAPDDEGESPSSSADEASVPPAAPSGSTPVEAATDAREVTAAAKAAAAKAEAAAKAAAAKAVEQAKAEAAAKAAAAKAVEQAKAEAAAKAAAAKAVEQAKAEAASKAVEQAKAAAKAKAAKQAKAGGATARKSPPPPPVVDRPSDTSTPIRKGASSVQATPSEAPPVPRTMGPSSSSSALLGKARGGSKSSTSAQQPTPAPRERTPSYVSESTDVPEPLVDFGETIGAQPSTRRIDAGEEPPTDEVVSRAHAYDAYDAPLDDEETQIGVDFSALRNGGVTETAYSAGGSAPVDTTDEGWDSSVHGGGAAQQRSPARGADSVLGRARGGLTSKRSAGGAKPVTAPPAPAQLFDDDLGATEQGLPGGMSDLADFDAGGEGPPTEEVPSAVLEDLGQLYNASMRLPQPASSRDLFADSEAPTVHASSSSVPRQPPSVPRNPPEVPKAPTPHYAPSASASASKSELPRTAPPARPMVYREEDDKEVEISEGGGWMTLLAGVIVLLTLAGVIAAVVLVNNRPAIGEQPVQAGQSTVVQAPASAPPAVKSPEAEAADPHAAQSSEEQAPAEQEADAPQNVNSETPNQSAAAPAPPPEPVAKSAPPPPAKPKVYSGQGTIKIRANKRVIVQVNGNLLDFAPVDLPYAAGDHMVGAMLPGQPDSLQEKPIKLRNGKTIIVDFDFDL